MKTHALILTIALAAVPFTALAQDPASPAPQHSPLTETQRQEIFSTFKTFGEKERQLRDQARSRMLAALTPEHKQLLAQMAGQLAIAEKPDRDAAAKQLDSALSASERQAVLAANDKFRTDSKALHDQMRAQIQSQFPNMPPPEVRGPGGPGGPGIHEEGTRQMRTRTAGEILLMTATGGGRGFGGFMVTGGPHRYR